jgi:uncharacterized protein YdaU (DUF1376 family)
LNIGEFLQDTAHLSTAEIGAYMLLIMHYWARGGPCPNLDAFRRVTRLDNRQWLRSGDVLRSFFNDNLTHNRLDKDLAQVIEKSEAKSANALEQHRKRRGNADVLHPVSTTDLRPKTEKERDVEGSARERAPAERISEAISPSKEAAIALSLSFLNAAGFADFADAPHNWYRVCDRAVIWLTTPGWTEQMIVAETRIVAGRGGAPMPISYYEKVFATAAARAAQPVPIAIVNSAEITNVVIPANRRGNISRAADELIAAARAREQADNRGSAGSGQGATRLLADWRG